ncbi:MAG: uroporphyrinogen decarboxylase family protein [Opitutaceae bacterium]|nr:uroporphyrinogen decarboxylase family protein [Opitutaceae bacterium]
MNAERAIVKTGSTTNCFNRAVLAATRRQALPIAVYPGLALTGAKVSDIVTNPVAQVEAQAALHERYRTSFVLSAMDLSAEAEAFGSAIRFSEGEVPTVTGRLVTDLAGVERLAVPQPGDKRTAVSLEAVRGLRGLSGRPLVLGGCIGPFSLAARLIGVSEAMELTVTEPELMHALLAKSAAFLGAYVRALRDAGADGAIMAEPAAGLLSPNALGAFSSAYIKPIGESVADGHFALILHNCAAKLPHLSAVLASGLRSFHFGAPMDLAAALTKLPSDVVLCGNLDPAGVFCQCSPEQIRVTAADLLAKTSSFSNFVISSGCDLPPGVKLENLDAFYDAVAVQSASPTAAKLN